MADAPPSLLASLYLLSRIDGALTQISVERKALENSIKERKARLGQEASEQSEKLRQLNDRKSKHQREEKALNEERQKLMDRRKAISSFSGHRVQEAATREITATAEMLNAQEEALIRALTDIETVEQAYKPIETSLHEHEQEFKKFEKETQETFTNLEERQRLKETRRAELVSHVDRTGLSTYNRVHERFPQNTVVVVKDKTCSGCFQTLVPQTLVQISRGESIIKCPGCGRILCLESHIQESKEE